MACCDSIAGRVLALHITNLYLIPHPPLSEGVRSEHHHLWPQNRGWFESWHPYDPCACQERLLRQARSNPWVPLRVTQKSKKKSCPKYWHESEISVFVTFSIFMSDFNNNNFELEMVLIKIQGKYKQFQIQQQFL